VTNFFKRNKLPQSSLNKRTQSPAIAGSISRNKLSPVIGVVLLTVLIFALTKNTFTKSFVLQMTLVSLMVLLFYAYLAKKKGKVVWETKAIIFLITTFVLFLVASTGWFFSPFFFSLYLLGIVLAFVMSPAVSAGFIATLVGLFSFNIGEVDLAYDFLIVLSLLLIIPLSIYLRKQFLKLKEAQKDILVLNSDQKREFQNKLEEVLANKVNNFAVEIRQPINDIKQLSYKLEASQTKEDFEERKKRIIASSEGALRMLKDFEEEATGKKLLSTSNNL